MSTKLSNNSLKRIAITIKTIELIIYQSFNLKRIQLKKTFQKSNYF